MKNKIFLTQEGKEEIEAKIAEIEKYKDSDQCNDPRDWSFVSGREFTLNEILSSATVLPVEENWEDVELYPPDNENQFEKTISLKNGVIIKPKGL
jgi:hypothetical protein